MLDREVVSVQDSSPGASVKRTVQYRYGGGDGGGDDEIVCPVSDTGKFENPPSGPCTGVGSCAIELDNSCHPGVNAVPSTPAVYECQCVSTQWQCAVKSGGLGLTLCGDAGGSGQ